MESVVGLGNSIESADPVSLQAPAPCSLSYFLVKVISLRHPAERWVELGLEPRSPGSDNGAPGPTEV